MRHSIRGLLEDLVRLTESNARLELFHGSSSEKISGDIRMNERDSGWFGNGFYLSAFPDYAKRWGAHVHKMTVSGKFAEVQVIGNYKELRFDKDAAIADKEAGGTVGWIENEHAWSSAFAKKLKQMGYDGIRVHFDENKDVEVVVFEPDKTITAR